MWGILQALIFCSAVHEHQFLARVGGKERDRESEREAPAICATGNSTAIAHPHLLLLLSAFFSPSLSFLLLP